MAEVEMRNGRPVAVWPDGGWLYQDDVDRILAGADERRNPTPRPDDVEALRSRIVPLPVED